MITAFENRRIQNLDGLSEVIIETLKLLSTEQQPLSISFLSQALGKRDEVQSMLAAAQSEKKNGTLVKAAESPEGKNGSFDPGRQAKTAERDSILRAGAEEQEEILRTRDFLRRSTSTLVSLANRSRPEGALSRNLSAFRQAVREGRKIEELEISLGELKSSITVIIDEDDSADPGPDQSELGVQDLSKLQTIFLNIIAEFDQDLGEDYSKKLARLRRNLASGFEPGAFTALEHDLIELIRAYNGTLNEERNQITDLISEIGGSLMEIEQQFLHSMTQSEQSQTADSSLHSLIEGHMEEVKRSAQLSSTLAEFRSLVMSRLASIREALEQKRRAEELREETLHGEMENLQQNLQRMKKEIDQVQEKRKALEKEILIDQLTGIANRRAAKRRLKEEIQRYHRYRQYFSVLMFDIDHFKSVNDRFGHWAGDKCLKELIKRIKPMLRETDFLARWGGEEFVILFPGTEMDSAAGVAERLRKAIENTRFLYNKQEIAVTVSIGVTEVTDSDMTLEAIFNRTDKAMYVAKKKGRNLVVTG